MTFVKISPSLITNALSASIEILVPKNFSYIWPTLNTVNKNYLINKIVKID